MATLYPSQKLPKIKIFSYDKIGHFAMFGVWTFLYGLASGFRKNKMPNLWFVFIYGAVFGILIEFLQYALPVNRYAEFMDLVADILGAAAAALILRPVLKRYLGKVTGAG